MAARDRLIQGGKVEWEQSLEGTQECMTCRKRALKANQKESMSEERRACQGVEERRSLILEISAWLYDQMRRLDDFTRGKKEDGGKDTERRMEL